MPNLPHSAHVSIGSLRTYLESLLPTSRLMEVAFDSTREPILLLQTRHLIAAFAVSGIDLHASYNDLYGKFKNYYMQQEGHWDALDLAFIFCAQPGVRDIDNFCSKIETDVYFCRKFVVLLEQPLGASLSRLPFLPLASLNGHSMRPASAQTFLHQQCTVPALLARYIVVQRERSPEGIVEDCISGKFGEPREFSPVMSKRLVQHDNETKSAKLQSVTIENFRAYRKPQTFEIGADVTVLYGPNGFGKTSFFDAIDFAVTGGIGRFESINDAHFTKTAQHLDSKSEGSSVSITFERNGTKREVKRSVIERKHALLDGQPTDRKSILNELTTGTIPPADRVDNFVNLFRAMHLFSQEQQELTKDFQQDCQLSADIVSRMLAFEDYVNAVNKTEKVCDVLQNIISVANREIQELSGQINKDRMELEQLGQMTDSHPSVEALDKEIEELRARIVTTGIIVPPQKPDAAVIRGWRAALEARLADSQSRINRLSSLSKEAVGLQRLHTDLASIQQQVGQKEELLRSFEEKSLAADTALHQAELFLTAKKLNYAEAQDHADLLEWIRATRPEYAQHLEKFQLVNGELAQATTSLEQHHTTAEEKARELNAIKSLIELSSEKLQAKRVEHSTLQGLNESIAAWQTDSSLLIAVVESEQAAIKSLESLRTEEHELSLQVVAMAEEEARVSRQIAEVERDLSELQSLLSQMQLHVHSSTCPLCGEDHGTKDELIRRIQQRLHADTANTARGELAGVLERARQFAERLADNKQKQQTAASQIAELKKERARLGTEIDQFTSDAISLGFIVDSSEPTLAEQLQVRLERVNHDIGDLTSKIQEAGAGEEAVRTSLESTKSLIADIEATISSQRSELARLQEDINRLRSNPRMTHLSLDIDEEKLLELERINRTHLIEFNEEVVKAQQAATLKKSETSALRQEITSFKAQITTMRTQAAGFQNMLTQINARLEESELPTDASEELLLGLIKEETRVQAQISLLLESTTNLEMAIDAATTAAAHTNLLRNIRTKEKTVAEAERRRDQHQPWLVHFEEISRVLSSHQHEAIANFTREFGPRTSVIQRRLRSVYGFDDIEISSRESKISVRVKRNGEELRPTDYFSQSQKQTLLLGLFLTACSSQTWSAFSTVFLDDPVTHFDDLNTYALLDLVVGLIESDFGNRQFVISTCDEKLLQLARQKFRHLGERAKFYGFSAFGPDGPTVDKIDAP